VELEKQDRSAWDGDLIALATKFLHQSMDAMLSTYHLEASIAYLHCSAVDFESTNWKLIVALYEQMLRANPNPFVEVNYSIALFHAGDRARAFQILEALQRHPFFHRSVSLTATLGKLHLLDGNRATAKAFLQRALAETRLDAEKDLFTKLIHRCS
jgi:RNA polymerase sigma-70 factor (ECF subfamily)